MMLRYLLDIKVRLVAITQIPNVSGVYRYLNVAVCIHSKSLACELFIHIRIQNNDLSYVLNFAIFCQMLCRERVANGTTGVMLLHLFTAFVKASFLLQIYNAI